MTAFGDVLSLVLPAGRISQVSAARLFCPAELENGGLTFFTPLLSACQLSIAPPPNEYTSKIKSLRTVLHMAPAPPRLAGNAGLGVSSLAVGYERWRSVCSPLLHPKLQVRILDPYTG